MQAYPDASKDREFVVHYALNRLAGLETLSELLRTYPDSARERNNEGDLLLHIALKKQLGTDVISSF